MSYVRAAAVRNTILPVLALCLFAFCLCSCAGQHEEGFGIYLAGSGELLLSEKHMEAFCAEEDQFVLNGSGMERWNSFQVYETVPRLADSLYQSEFVIRIDGKEICRGRFWSSASSMSCSGIVILDALFQVDSDYNTLKIRSGYGTGENPLDASVKSSLVSYFEGAGLLR